MPFLQNNGVRFFQFNNFADSIVHAVFTRQGGISPAPWDSLNVGGTVGDEPERVRENRARSFSASNRSFATLFDVWQVHSADVVHADAPRDPAEELVQADIILTDKPEVTLYMRFADCVPVLFHDPIKAVVGISHAGWLGTVRGVSEATVRAMQDKYGSKPANIMAAIGPSIGPDHYEIGPDVIEQIQNAFDRDAEHLLESRNGKTYLDLWMANYLQLQKSGVEQIEGAGICTACHLEDWFSHRAERGKTGRFGALIGLQA
jgi:purine-nucleoside/S-methyl-5'-thioadenosine phosphorylase / adenosine deaminase